MIRGYTLLAESYLYGQEVLCTLKLRKSKDGVQTTLKISKWGRDKTSAYKKCLKAIPGERKVKITRKDDLESRINSELPTGRYDAPSDEYDL